MPSKAKSKAAKSALVEATEHEANEIVLLFKEAENVKRDGGNYHNVVSEIKAKLNTLSNLTEKI